MRALVIGIGVVLIAALVVALWSGGPENSAAAVQAPRVEGEALRENVELEPFVAMRYEPPPPDEAILRRNVERDVVPAYRAVRFWVRAVDARGNGLPFAVLEVVEQIDGDEGLAVRTVADRHGRFEWISSAAEVALKVTTSRMGIRLGGEVRCEVALARTTPCDVMFEPLPVLISGRVVDARGLPIPSARVRATLVNEWAELGHEPTVVEDGMLSDFTTRRKVESMLAAELSDSRPEAVRIPLEVAAKSLLATTDSRGGFKFQGDTGGGWVSVDVQAGGFQSVERLTWLRGTSNVTIVLDAVATVKGRLLLHPSVDALGLAVAAQSPLGTLAGGRGAVLHDGQFVLTQLPGGTFTLQLSSSRFHAPSLELPIVLAKEVSMAAGEILDIGVIDLSDRLLATRFDFDETMWLSIGADGIGAKVPFIFGGPDQSSPTILHGPGNWTVPLHADGYRSTHVQLTGGTVRVELEPENE